MVTVSVACKILLRPFFIVVIHLCGFVLRVIFCVLVFVCTYVCDEHKTSLMLFIPKGYRRFRPKG